MKEIFILLYIAGVAVAECPGGWTRRGDTAWCYKAFEDKTVSWNTAQQECTKYGADLVSYESKAEMEWVYNILNWNQDRAEIKKIMRLNYGNFEILYQDECKVKSVLVTYVGDQMCS